MVADWAPFEELDHTADLCLCVRGATLPALFVHAAQGMFHLMQCEPCVGCHAVSYALVLEAYDLETLLVDWLGELLYLGERDRACLDDPTIIHLDATHLEAQVRGKSPCTVQRGIKAVTFGGLQIVQRPEGFWETVITFDV